ncbi:NAD(P)H-binding protein [Flavobacteriales bacterium]|nr:NAD(P)H-binding protein [Flavobacteriales bacterium]
MKKLHALVLGATGATGQEIVKLLLEDSNFCKVSVFVRGTIDIDHEKLIIHKINFSRLSEYNSLVKGDVLFSALGTTKQESGGEKEQFLVDYTYQYEFAKMASENGVSHYSLVSSIGANKNSLFFYPKIKGDLEESVKSLQFNKIQIFQPPSLIRQPELIRSGEKNSIKILKGINKLGFLKSFKPLLVKDLAMKIINESLLTQIERITIYKSKDLFN